MSISKLIGGIAIGGGKCCGCTSCVQRCPKHCISLSEDSEGFLYPQVDEAVCTECGLCEKVCPILNPQEKIKPLKVLAVKDWEPILFNDGSSYQYYLYPIEV